MAALGLTISVIRAFADNRGVPSGLEADAENYGQSLAVESREPGRSDRAQEDYYPRQVKQANKRGYHSQEEVDRFVKIAEEAASKKGEEIDQSAHDAYLDRLMAQQASDEQHRAVEEAQLKVIIETRTAAIRACLKKLGYRLSDYDIIENTTDLKKDPMIEIFGSMNNDQTDRLMNAPLFKNGG